MADADWINQINPLITRIQRKDKLALNTLYDIGGGRMFSIILRIVKDRAEAEDTLQEVFIKVWEQSNKYRGTGSAWGWLCVLTRHAALDRLRSLNAHPHVSLNNEDESALERLFTTDNTSDSLSINRCLGQLKTQTRQSVLMSFVHGYSHSELANEFSAPLGTVKAWVRRGLQELKKCLAA